MLIACQEGHLSVCQWLFEVGVSADITRASNNGSTPMLIRPRTPSWAGGARSEGGRISATGGKFWAKIRILWGSERSERLEPAAGGKFF